MPPLTSRSLVFYFGDICYSDAIPIFPASEVFSVI
jgi:hypothetical protein